MTPPTARAAAEAQPCLPDVAAEPETPIFVSADGRRARLLKRLGQALVALTVLWLAALLAGALGLGRLTSLPLPHTGWGNSRPAAPPGDTATRSKAARPAIRSKAAPRATTTGRAASQGATETNSPATKASGNGERGFASGGTGGSGGLSAHRVPAAVTPPAKSTVPAAKSSTPSTTTSPVTSGSAPGATHRNSDPGAGPSATGQEHSPRWGGG